VVKARRVLHYRVYKGKQPYVSKWPKARGPAKKPAQKAWIEHFVKWAHWSKQPDPCAVATADTLAPTTGYWPRDIIHRAGAGKYNHHRPKTPLNSPLPWLYMHPPSLYYEGPPKVKTPTTRVTRLVNQSVPNGSFTPLVPTAKTWDNNAFWDPLTDPQKLTFKADGLYIVTALVKYTAGSTAMRESRIEHSNGAVLDNDEDQNSLGFGCSQRLMCIYYFYAGEWVQVTTNPNASGQTCQLWDFTVMAITPETII